MTPNPMANYGSIAAAVAALLVATTALAQSSGLAAADKRHENFGSLGKAFKTLKEELAKDTPDKAVVSKSASTVNDLAHNLPTWFPKGSGKEAQPKSEALPEIWSDASGFKIATTKFQDEAAKLDQLARAGDVDAARAQFRATGQACGACHRVYREKKN